VSLIAKKIWLLLRGLYILLREYIMSTTMNKHIKQLFLGALLTLFFTVGAAVRVHAYMVPILSINNLNNGYIQVTVSADPNSTIQLYHYNPSYVQPYNQYFYAYRQSPYNIASAGVIGYTDNNGYFSTAVTNSQYNIPAGDSVYVSVNGVSSGALVWPISVLANMYAPQYPNPLSYVPTYIPSYTYPSISLSQNSITMTSGQNQTINIYGSGSYYVFSTSNSNVASANISGSSLSIYSSNPGTSQIAVCQSEGSCAVVVVTVVLNNSYYGYQYPPCPCAYNQQYYSYQSPAQYAYPGSYYNNNQSYDPNYIYYNNHYYPRY